MHIHEKKKGKNWKREKTSFVACKSTHTQMAQ